MMLISEKWKNGKKETKARLVAKGFQEKHIDIRRDSPTCIKESLRLIFCVAASKNWTVRILDIKSAFLQGKDIERTVYLKPPEETGTSDKLWKLLKTLYGLGDASRQWYLRIKDSLEKYGVTMSVHDEALFYYYSDNLQGLIALHVDDFFHCGTNVFQSCILTPLKREFEVSKEAETSFNYLGLEIEQLDNGMLLLHQKKYIQSLKTIDWYICR